MDKLDVVKKIQDIGVVSVVRGKTPEEAIMMSEACIKGDVTAIELAFTTPRAHEVIEALSKKYADNPDVIIGAGTVLDAITARIAILAGAQFIVCRHWTWKRLSSATATALPSCRERRPSTALLRPWNTALTSSRSSLGKSWA